MIMKMNQIKHIMERNAVFAILSKNKFTRLWLPSLTCRIDDVYRLLIFHVLVLMIHGQLLAVSLTFTSMQKHTGL